MAKSKIKVLLCSPRSNTGGISMWTRHILDYFTNNNSNICVDWYYNENSENKLQKHFLPRVVSGIRQYIPLIKGIYRKLKGQSYDILHICSSASFGLLRDLWLLRISKRYNVRSIVHLHFGRIPTILQQRGWEYKLLHKVICNASKVVVIDETSYKVLLANGYSNIELLPNPLSPSIVALIESNKNITRDKNKVLFVGHVVRGKGIMELIEACKQLSNTMDNFSLKVLGLINDDMRSIIQVAAGDNYSNWLNICGNQTIDEVIKEMLSASVFALPTYSEGFPNVILESMACGCPIVTTPVGAIPEMLAINSTSPCGVCVEIKNTTQLKDAIQRMLTDRAEAERLGSAAKHRVIQEYYMDVVGARLTNIWQ